MTRHGFLRGEYNTSATRCLALWSSCGRLCIHDWHLLRIRWTRRYDRVDIRRRTPGFFASCHDVRGNAVPTPLLNCQYGEGDYNCLHKDYIW